MSAEQEVAGERPRVASVSVGDAIGPLHVHVDRPRLVEYAAASGDRNRIHWDERFAISAGLPGVIAHGMFTMGAASELVAGWAGGAAHVRDYQCRFTKPVVVPDEGCADLTVSGVVKKVDDEAATATIDLTVEHEGVKVLTKALAIVDLLR